MPSCWPSWLMRRTSRARMRSLIRCSLAVAMADHSCAMGCSSRETDTDADHQADVRAPPLHEPSGSGSRDCALSIDPDSRPPPGRRQGGRVGAGRPVGRPRGCPDPSWSSVVPDRLADVSSLWTPDGEHPVGERRTPRRRRGRPRRAGAPGGADDAGRADASDEAALRAEIDEARARVAEVPGRGHRHQPRHGAVRAGGDPPLGHRRRTWPRPRWPSTPSAAWSEGSAIGWARTWPPCATRWRRSAWPSSRSRVRGGAGQGSRRLNRPYAARRTRPRPTPDPLGPEPLRPARPRGPAPGGRSR